MLFRVEAAAQIGATCPSSTSMLAKWNAPAGCKIMLKHKPISELVFNKFHYKKASQQTDERLTVSQKCFKALSMTSEDQQRMLQDSDKIRHHLYQKLKNIA